MAFPKSLLETTLNTRDLGGYQSELSGKRLKSWSILRSDVQNYPSDHDISLLKKHNILTIIDMRGKKDVLRKPSGFADKEGFVYTATGSTGEMTQTAQIKRLNPGGSNILGSENENFADVIFEPNRKEVLSLVVPKYLQTLLYGRLTEAIVCEQAARRNAMDSATDNAEELLDKLHIEYNKARQGAITQEITEVIGGSINK